MKGKKILALALVMLLLTSLLPTTVLAAGSAGIVQGTSVLSKGANTSDAATVYYGGKTWRVIAYDSGSITLLAAENFGHTKYDSSGNNSNAYGTSTLKTAIEDIAVGFSSGEVSAVIPRTLEGGSGNYGTETYDSDKINGDPVENALLWPLSIAEANSLNNELRKADPANTGWLSSYWWLRSPCYTADYAAIVYGDGYVNGWGNSVNNNELGVRPAFYVNPESVLFTSAAAGGKSSGVVGAGALKEVSASDTSVWTLTLLDPGHNSFSIDPCAVTYDSETNVVTVPYSGAMTGSNEFISAIIKDSSGNITYYGRVAQLGTAAAASGSIMVNLAGKLNAGDTLFIFNEQVNSPETAPPETVAPVGTSDTQTDYASALIEIEIPPKGHSWEWVTDKEPTCGEAGSKHEECSVCDAKRNEGTESPATGEHSWQWVTDKEPTCGEAGTKHEECTECGAKRNEGTEIPATGEHTWQWVTDKEPTCGEAGTKHEECTECGAKQNEGTEILAFGHDWGEWTVTKEPEVGKPGERQRTCSRRGETETEVIPALIGYSVAQGANGIWTKGSTDGYTITVKRSEDDASCFTHYVETLIDGKAVTVSAKSGSTVVTINAETLETLSTGTHTVTIKFDDGEATLSLTVNAAQEQPDTPKTGDESHVSVWLILMFLSLTGSAALLISKKRFIQKREK